MSILFKLTSPTDQRVMYSMNLQPGIPLVIGRDDPIKTKGPFICLETKVVSRTHAIVTVTESGKVFVQDTKSSAGTFLNSIRLSAPKTRSEEFELVDGDFLQFGEDCEFNGVPYKSALFRVAIVPITTSNQEKRQSKRGELSSSVQEELDQLWAFMRKNYAKENPLVHAMLDRITQLREEAHSASS